MKAKRTPEHEANLIFGKRDITYEYIKWAKAQYGDNKKNIVECNGGDFMIYPTEIEDTILNTNPNKAIGKDNISYKPLDRKECT